MRSMHLPEAIEVSAGSGVPPSILQKAAEMRVKGRDPRTARQLSRFDGLRVTVRG